MGFLNPALPAKRNCARENALIKRVPGFSIYNRAAPDIRWRRASYESPDSTIRGSVHELSNELWKITFDTRSKNKISRTQRPSLRKICGASRCLVEDLSS